METESLTLISPSDEGFDFPLDMAPAVAGNGPPLTFIPGGRVAIVLNATLEHSALLGATDCTNLAASACSFLSSEYEHFLERMDEDFDQMDLQIRLSPSASLGRRFIEEMGMSLARVPRVRCAVFGDAEDSVELVAHSRSTLRQVSFEFSPGGEEINIVFIDENMHSFSQVCDMGKKLTLRNAIKWLKAR